MPLVSAASNFFPMDTVAARTQLANASKREYVQKRLPTAGF